MKEYGNLSFRYAKILKGVTDAFHGCENSRKIFLNFFKSSSFVSYSYLNYSAFTAVKRNAKV